MPLELTAKQTSMCGDGRKYSNWTSEHVRSHSQQITAGQVIMSARTTRRMTAEQKCMCGDVPSLPTTHHFSSKPASTGSSLYKEATAVEVELTNQQNLTVGSTDRKVLDRSRGLAARLGFNQVKSTLNSTLTQLKQAISAQPTTACEIGFD